MTALLWHLRHLSVTNILGFLETKEVAFQQGLQVVYADNHTGKTSLALSLLWCLTGQLPSIGRITGNKFKLKHKCAADKELGGACLTLEDAQLNTLHIRRTVKSGSKTAKLIVTRNGEEFEDDRAQQIIDDSIGLKHHSLEGCRVVLQDQRLSLITGDMKKSSDVIHEILGLSMLSKLVPILNDKISQLGKLIKEYEHMDPRKKWDEHHLNLAKELKEKERDATAHGCNSKDFNLSKFLHDEFKAICNGLNLPYTPDAGTVKDTVIALRQAIKERRTQSPLKAKLNELAERSSLLKAVHDRICREKTSAQEAMTAYTASANRYKIGHSDLGPQLKMLEGSLAEKHSALNRLKEQHGLYISSLSLLQQHEEIHDCPLCCQTIDRNALIRDLHHKIDQSTNALITGQEKEIHHMVEQKTLMEDLQREYRQWEHTIRQALHDGTKALEKIGKGGEALLRLSESPLCCLPTVAATYNEVEGAVQKDLEEALNEQARVNNHARHDEEQLTPYEERLDKIAMYLIPIHEVHSKLLEHDKLKEVGEAQSGQFADLLAQARGYHSQLSEFKNLLQAQEKEKANRAMAEHQDFVSRFFMQVAGNPNYDRITITAEQTHGSVKYDFEASSSLSPHYTDAAKHVLSGGDLSCACLGLMLSLMQGKANKSNFLVLDDPGESLDDIRMGNLAAALQNAGGQQTIVLTHQREFAEKLRQAGAATVTL